MTASLTVHNAEITTATVQIQTLTISGKQVTLAVFRQLPSADLIDPDGLFKGTPWGTVNYHPDKCGGDSAHVHVVWQDGATLRRDSIERPRRPRLYTDNTDSLVQADCTWTGENGYGKAWPAYLPKYVSAYTPHGSVYFDFMVDGLSHPCVANSPDRQTAEEQDRLKADRDMIRASLEYEIREERIRETEFTTRWDELQALPQLYIAV